MPRITNNKEHTFYLSLKSILVSSSTCLLGYEDVREEKDLVAADDSKESIYALRRFLDHQIPENIPRKLILLYAQPPLPVYYMYGSGYLFADVEIESMQRYRKELALSVLTRAQNICRNYNNIEVEVMACSEDPRVVTCEMVEKLEADILVMRSCGYGFIKRALLGSVTDYRARNAKCPVVIVKRAAES